MRSRIKNKTQMCSMYVNGFFLLSSVAISGFLRRMKIKNKKLQPWELQEKRVYETAKGKAIWALIAKKKYLGALLLYG